jgi:hypothetical protein
MKNLITRGICLALTLVLAFSLTACVGNNGGETTESTTTPTTTAPETTAPVASGSAMGFITLSYGENFDSVINIMAYTNDDGTATIDYQGEIRKSGTVDASIMDALAAEFAVSGLPELHDQSQWEEGEASGSMYVTFDNETVIYSVDFSGNVPQAYIDGFNKIHTLFVDLIAEVPEYVPEATVIGNVDETVLAEMKNIISNTSMPQDTLAIYELALDDAETFGFSAGLSSSEGIVNAANCNSSMMTSAYSLVIVTVEDAANIASVRADFEANLAWGKWVCVRPTGALIAQKDNMVICLMGMNESYTETEAAITAAGWTEIATFTDPEM